MTSTNSYCKIVKHRMTVTGVKRKREGLLETLDCNEYSRRPLKVNAEEEDLVFQLLECEDASKDKCDTDTSLLRLHGVSSHGSSIIVLIRGFRQYLYFPVSKSFTEDDIPELSTAIAHNTKTPVTIASMEIVKRDPLEYYRANPEDYQRYVKIYVDKPQDVTQIGNVLGKSDELPKLLNMFRSGKLYSSQAYETGINYDLRFMADLSIVGCGWLRLTAGKYKQLGVLAPYDRVCGLFECHYTAIEGLSPDSTEANDQKTRDWSKLASLRCLIVNCITLDDQPLKGTSSVNSSPKKPKSSKINAKPKVKMSSADMQEPSPFIATISVILSMSPLANSDSDITLVLTHGKQFHSTLGDVPNLRVHSFVDERTMLQAFGDLFLSYDPDVVSGYDMSEAISSILTRGLEVGLPKVSINLARCSHISLKTKRRQIYSGAWLKKERKMNATSNREQTELGCIGRLVLDLRVIIEREERLRTYSLNEAAVFITHRTLEKLSDPVLLSLWTGEDTTRLVDYAIGEVQASTGILRRNASLVTYVELSRVTGLNFEDVVLRGQMKRFWSQLFRFCGKRGVIVPAQSRGGEQMSQSALNYMPDVGYDTENPVVVLDFKSLYPSILIARNLCFSTELGPGDQFEGPLWTGFGGCKFVSAEVKEGIVPAILKHFLSERTKVKLLMKNEQDQGVKTVLDGRQKAIKVCANAIYGFMGARESKLQNLAIADGTITEGARLLEEAKQEIEKRYNTPGKDIAVKVVYGDTDSVFVKCYGKSVAEAIEFGKQISADLTWTDPIQLDFEKVLFPSLLQNRKRYAGLLWTNSDKPDEIDVKGIEVNRRDAVPLIGHVIGDVFGILFPHKNNSHEGTARGFITSEDRNDIIEKVKESVKKDVSMILNGELDIGSFIMTKGLWLGTSASDYSAKQTHISVLEKMQSRDPRRLFKDGERISYCFVQSTPNSKGYEKAEDPVWAIDRALLLDYQYYLEHTVRNPLQRILELLMPSKDIDTLFKTTKTSKVVSAKATGVMGAFLSAGKKTLSKCEICGEQCLPGKKLCKEHEQQSLSLSQAKQSKLLALRQQRDERYATCHACQRSTRAILCVNMDCSVYFSRKRLEEETLSVETDLTTFTEAQRIKLDW